jgi:hypothetical protein
MMPQIWLVVCFDGKVCECISELLLLTPALHQDGLGTSLHHAGAPADARHGSNRAFQQSKRQTGDDHSS